MVPEGTSLGFILLSKVTFGSLASTAFASSNLSSPLFMARFTAPWSFPDREHTRSTNVLFYKNCFAFKTISVRLSWATREILPFDWRYF